MARRNPAANGYSSSSSILVLEKTLRLLNRFDSGRPEWGVTELSRDLRINKSTVSKILSTLEGHRYLTQNPETRRYRLGLRFFEIGSLVAEQMDLQKVAFPHMEELNKRVQETVHLVILDGFDIVYINKVESSQSLRIGTQVGIRLPAYCTGVGKILLAGLPSEEIKKYLRKAPLKKLTPQTITQPERLKEALEQIRRQGHAVDNEEFSVGLMCVAAPIYNYSRKQIAGISISGPANRMKEKKLEELISFIKDTAREISRQLGYNQDGIKERPARRGKAPSPHFKTDSREP